MKKLLLLITALFITIGVHSQGLRPDAIKVKQDLPEQYYIIKKFAEKTWEGDNTMIVDEINVQCESFFWLAKLISKYQGSGSAGKVMIDGMLKFSHEGWKEHNRKMIDEEKINLVHVNWADVFIYVDYELRNQ